MSSLNHRGVQLKYIQWEQSTFVLFQYIHFSHALVSHDTGMYTLPPCTSFTWHGNLDILNFHMLSGRCLPLGFFFYWSKIKVVRKQDSYVYKKGIHRRCLFVTSTVTYILVLCFFKDSDIHFKNWPTVIHSGKIKD